MVAGEAREGRLSGSGGAWGLKHPGVDYHGRELGMNEQKLRM